MSFAGQGFVVVQPSEEPPGGIAGRGAGQQQQGGVLGGLLGLTVAVEAPLRCFGHRRPRSPAQVSSPARRRASQAAESA